jgi:hypothetical protein
MSPATHKRHWHRHVFRAEHLCFIERGGEDPWPAFLVDVCPDGLRLLVPRRQWTVGDVLPVQLLKRSGERFTRDVRVVHQEPAVPTRHWFVGGTFLEPLSADELRDIVAAPPS